MPHSAVASVSHICVHFLYFFHVWCDLFSHVNSLCNLPFYIFQVFVDPRSPDAKPSIRTSQKGESFQCIEPDCVKLFKKHEQLIQHLSTGKHVYDDENLDDLGDKSKRLWAARCREIRFNQPTIPYDSVDDQSKFNENQGYALKRRKKAVRFSPKVKTYLAKIFEAGEDSGKKASPYTVAKQMRNELDGDGSKMFSPSEWLSHQQIRSYFGNLCVKKQKEINKQKEVNSVELVKVENACNQDEVLEDVINDLMVTEHEQILSSIVNSLTD